MEIRKVVTIVFVDLAGSTSLQEHMDPESVRRVMERFYATMRAEIEAANGVVVKFTGDGVMAGFGIREAREDDAFRAIRAALTMQDSFNAFALDVRDARGAKVSLRVGINTGEVVVSEADDDVVGDVVNVAARLEHAAGDGNILVGPDTWRLTRHLVTFEAIAPLDLRGKAEPVPAYRVVSLQARPEEDAVAPFVGRDAELGRLREVFERCVSLTSPAIITVVGSPGLGKTRLAGELVSWVSDRATVLDVRCDAAATATYAPIAEAFREAANVPETAGGTDVVGAIEGLLAADFAERDRIAKLVASLLGVGEPATPQETFWAVRRLLEGMAQARPLLLVVDDVQWAEPMLLDLLDHVVDWAKGAAIMIAALARPEIREVRPSLADAGAIVLEGLDPADTAELAQGLLGAHDLPAALVRRILATTEGNPLFVRELLRMLVDDGVLSRDGERWAVTVEADEIDVPPTIHALLSARIERLRDHERAVVERASVVGQEFYRGAVLELVPPLVRNGIDDHLETLRRKELVEPEGSYWIDERVFRFHHVLIRDAAYRRLLKEARADLHERFADWLEAKVGELVGEHDEVLGYHLEQAHTYLRELGSLDDRAIDLGRRASVHLASASRRALDRDDLAAAATLSGRALALTDDGNARATILLDRCEALLAMGDVTAASEAVDDLRRRASDDRERAWADCFDGQFAILTDPARLRETAAAVEDAARRLEALGDSAGAAKGHAVHAQALAHLGQFGACEAALDRALASARAAGDRRRANAVLASAPLAALWGPSPVPRASGRCLDVVRVLRITAGAPAVEATALRCQAVLEAMRGRSDAAHRMLASARSALEELGLRHALVECDMFSGLIDLFSGDPTSAQESLRSAYEGFRVLNIDTDIAQAAALLARSLVEQGRDEEALVLTEESERLGGDDLKTAIAWRTVRARILARRGEAERAIELARAAVTLAEPTDALIDLADARLALAEVLAMSGHGEEAQAEASTAADLYARKEAKLGGRSHAGPQPTPTRERREGGVRAAPGVDADETVVLLDRYRRSLLARDWAGLADLYAEDHVMIDHRSGLRAELVERDPWIDALRETWKDTESEWDFEVVGAWPQHLYLVRVASWSPAWERSYMLFVAMDDDAVRAKRTEIFDDEDHASAIATLDELAGHPSVAGLVLRHFDRHAHQDWDALRGLWAPDVTLVDHRPVGWGTLHGIESGIEVLQEGARTAGVTPDGLRITEWIAITADAALFRYRWKGRSPQGVDFSWDRLLLTQIVAGLLVRADMFDTDQLDDARRLMAGEVPHRVPPRGGVGAAPGLVPVSDVSIWERFRIAMLARDWQAIAELLTDDHVYVDHRSGLRSEVVGRDAFLDGARATWEGVAHDWDIEVIAEWSKDIVLARQCTFGDGWERSQLVVTVDRDGVCCRTELFDEDDPAVFDRLDQLVGESRPRQSHVRRTIQSYVDAHNAHDWEGVRRLLEPSYVLDDRRPLGWGRLDLDGMIEHFQEGVRSTAALKVGIERWISIGPTFCGYILRWNGTTNEDADFSYPRIVVASIGTSGTCAQSALFDLDQMEEAERALELAGQSPWITESQRGPDPKLGMAAFARLLEAAFNDADLEALRALYSPDFRISEHGHHIEYGLDELFQTFRETADLPHARCRQEVASALGTRHGVLRSTFSWDHRRDAGARSENAFVSAIRLDEHGRLLSSETFPADQLHRALMRAEQLLVEDEGTSETAAGARRRLKLWSIVDLHNADDFDELARSFAPSVVFLDRRQLGWGAIEGRDAVMDVFRAVRHRSAEHRWAITEVHAIADDGCVYSHPFEGVDQDGGRYEGGRVVAALLSDRGIEALELFALDDVEGALRRFDELRTDRNRPARTVGEWFERVLDRLRAGDLQGYGDLWTEDVTHDEKRPQLLSVAKGRHAAMDSLLHVKNLAAMRVDTELIASRGDRLELRMVRYVGEDTEGGLFDVPILQLHVMNDEGLVEHASLYEPDDVRAALEELDDRCAATLPPRQGEVLRALSVHMEMYNDHRWDGYASTFAPDVKVIDHRPAGWGEVFGIDDFLQHIRALVELLPDAAVSRSFIDRIEDDGVVATVGVKGTDTNGGLVEFAYHAVIMFREGKISVFELFPIDEQPAALARFEAVTRVAPISTVDGLANGYTRMYDRWLDAMRRGDWEAATALQAPDIVLDDRRPGIQHTLVGRDELLRSQREAVSLDYGLGAIEVVATRGDRLALHRIDWTLRNDSAVEMLVVGEMDHEGRMAASIVFATEDLESAVAELDSRYDVALPVRLRDTWRFVLELTEAYNTHDWERFFAMYDPQVSVVDRRPAWFGRPAPDDFSALIRGLVEVVPDVTVSNRTIDDIAEDGVAATVRFRGTDLSGNPVEIACAVAWVRKNEKVTHWELFPVEQREAAIARLRELSQPSTAIEHTWDRLLAALNDRDFERFAELHAPGFRQVWHKWHLEFDLDGLRAHLEKALRTSSRVGRSRSIVLGDRHGLFEMTWSIDPFGQVGESQSANWIVFRLDRQSKIVLTELYGIESGLLEALERVEELYLEDEASGGDEARWSQRRLGIWRTLLALNDGTDPADLAQRFPLEVVMLDHRPAGAGELHGNDAWVAWQNELIGATRDRRWDVRSVRLERNVVWLDMAITGTNEGGGPLEIPFTRITALDDALSELFAPEQRDDGERRFRELVEESLTTID